MQLKKDKRPKISSLKGCADYVAFGDQHYAEVFGSNPPSAYSGNLTGRDACTIGDTGQRCFLRVRITDTDVRVNKASIGVGGWLLKVRGPERGDRNGAIESAPEKYPITNQWSADQIADRMETITGGAWTGVATTRSLHNQKEVIKELESRFGGPKSRSFWMPSGVHYFFRK
jgi:hypothetical protein